MHEALIELKNAGVRRSGRDLLADVTWSLRAGEHWAVLGENGAGKSTFLRLVRGELPPTSGSRTYFLDGEPQSSPIGIRQRLPLVSPEMQETYAGPRDHEPAPMQSQSGEEAVLAGRHDSRLLYEDPGRAAREQARALLGELGLAELAAKATASMSTGQLRSILLARALFSIKDQGPCVLLLDECLDGLDRASRKAMLGLMEALGARVPLLVAAHRPGDLPGCVNRVLTLENGRVASQDEYTKDGRAGLGGADQGRAGLGVAGRDQVGEKQADSGCTGLGVAAVGGSADAATKVTAHKDAPRVHDAPHNQDATALKDATADQAAPINQDAARDQDAPFLFRLDGVSVVLEDKPVLQDIRWTVRPGEHWALVGENGAGKSTLLRLILGLVEPYGRPWPEYFGQSGPAELTEVRGRFGWLSTELQTNFERRATVRQAVLSGFFGSVGLFEDPTPEQEAQAREAMAMFGLEGLAHEPLSALSFGQVRRALLARAVAPRPEMLLLDEPLSGLDAATRRMALAAIDDLADSGSGLVWVSHRRGEMPACVDRVLALENGRVSCVGGRECLD